MCNACVPTKDTFVWNPVDPVSTLKLARLGLQYLKYFRTLPRFCIEPSPYHAHTHLFAPTILLEDANIERKKFGLNYGEESR
jgi:hypothetical protein